MRQDLVPESEDFDLVDSIIPILTKFESVSEALSGEKYPTMCMVIMKLYFIPHTLVTEAKKAGNSKLLW